MPSLVKPERASISRTIVAFRGRPWAVCVRLHGQHRTLGSPARLDSRPGYTRLDGRRALGTRDAGPRSAGGGAGARAGRSLHAPAEPPGSATSVGPRGRPDAPPEAVHQPQRHRAHLRRDRHHGTRNGLHPRQSPGQAVRDHRRSPPRHHHGRRGRPIWRSAWAWMPVDRTKGLFRLAWVVVSLIGLVALVGASILVILA